MPWHLTSREDLASLGQLEELVVRLDAGLWASADASPHRGAGGGAGGAWDDRHQGGGTWEAARGGAGMVEATDDGIMIGIATLCLLVYFYCYGNIHIYTYIYIWSQSAPGYLPSPDGMVPQAEPST